MSVKLWHDAIKTAPEAAELASMRKRAELTQTELAELMQLSSNRLISEYEQGKKTPTPQTYTLMLLLLGEHEELKVIKKKKV